MDTKKMSHVIVGTKYGDIKGKVQDDVLCWFGVPYAKPPVGDLRWKAPRTLDHWKGTLETIEFQTRGTQLENFTIVGGEDCLYLNIWRPISVDQLLPVLVYVHGGGNLIGSGDEFDGSVLATNTNSIIITINYRLGPLGWFKHKSLETSDPLDDSGNYGLLDIFKSLEWVQDNIEAFGGSKENVTLMGFSAGARNVLAALISPLAEHLFHKAIILSGGMTLTKTNHGESFSKSLIQKVVVNDKKFLNETDAMHWIDGLTDEELKSYLYKKEADEFITHIGPTAIKMDLFPHLYQDGYVIPKEGFDRIKTGDYHKVPIILGATSSEFAGFLYRDPIWGKTVEDRSTLQDKEIFKIYENAALYGSKLFAIFNTNQIASNLVYSNDHQKVYTYRFNWGLRENVVDPKINRLMGACHGIDIDFISGDFENGFMKQFYGVTDHFTVENESGRNDLSNYMMKYLSNFLWNSTPNGDNLPYWSSWIEGGEGCTLLLDADRKEASIQLTILNQTKEDILEEMNRNLDVKHYKTIVNRIFRGRFFWEY